MNAKVEDVKAGGIFQYDGKTWGYLGQAHNGAFAILKDSVKLMPFTEEDSKNYSESDVFKYLKETFIPALTGQYKERTVSLMATNGSTDYGEIVTKAAPPTELELTLYREEIPQTKEWWWLVTAESCEESYVGAPYMHNIKVGGSDNSIHGVEGDAQKLGVRPAVVIENGQTVEAEKDQLHWICGLCQYRSGGKCTNSQSSKYNQTVAEDDTCDKWEYRGI